MSGDEMSPDGYYTGRWNVFEHTCIRCGKRLATITPEPDSPTFQFCTNCIVHVMDQAIAAEKEDCSR